jgi:hypothetical protein
MCQRISSLMCILRQVISFGEKFFIVRENRNKKKKITIIISSAFGEQMGFSTFLFFRS